MKILGGVKQSYMFDLLLETRDADEQFEIYKSGGGVYHILLLLLICL